MLRAPPGKDLIRPDESSSPPEPPSWWNGGASILAGRIGDTLLRFALFFATARVLTGPEFSLYALLTAALGTAQGLFALGAPRTAAYFKSRASQSALTGWLVVLAVAPSAVLLALLFAVPALRTSLFPAAPAPLVFLGLLPLPALLLADSLSAILLAERRERLYGALLWLRSGATAVVLATSLLVANRLLWLLAGRAVVSLVLLVPLLRTLRVGRSIHGLSSLAPVAFRYGLPVAGAGVLNALHRRADVFLLSALGKTPEIGSYAIAYALAEAFWILTDSLEAALFVDLAGHGEEKARKETRRAAKVYGALAAAALVLGMAAGLAILRLGFSDRYPAASRFFPWLLVAAVAWGASRPFSSYLFSRGRGSEVLLSHAAGLALNAGLCTLWIPAAGALGAARATLASYGAEALLLAFLARRRAVKA
jgi:O-antigen/teichoic acid export membrane protein